MRLKSLEIKGFKSFANTTVINFDEKVVGIVGPNGSGKSNIVDAIRWVLGEQKGKELRLDSKTDVIFNGAKGKKAAGAAQVSICFDNTRNLLPTEYNEVTLTRILYRSGESEFRLNGVKCRLKDITNLLVDTGIGSNSYAIIALGMVEDILKDKDNARRKMFEQVSGISKYKKRKRETINKLNSTTEDLDRVEDLLFEILGNMKSLEKQAKRTERFFELKENYKALSLEHAALSMIDLKTKHNKYQKDIQDLQDKYRGLETALVQNEADIEKQKQVQLNSEKNLSDQQRVVNKLIADIREDEANRDLLKQELSFKKQAEQQAQDYIAANSTQLTTIQEEITLKTNSLKEKTLSLDRVMKDYEEFSNSQEALKKEYLDSKEVFDASTNKRQEIAEQRNKLAQDIAVLESGIQGMIEEKSRSTQSFDSRTSTLDNFKAESEKLAKSKNGHEETIAQLIKEKEEKEAEITLAENEKKSFEDHLVRLDRSLDAKNNEQGLLRSMIDNLEGYPESIKFLTKSKANTGVILSDILDVQKQYKVIIEHFLEPFLNHFVVNNLSEAAGAIDLLKSAQKGKAHFFLLDQYRKLGASSLDIPGVIPASSVIKVDAKYHNLMNTLLDRVFIYEGDLTDAALKNYDDYIFISAAGSFVKRASEVSGGSVGLFEGKKIGRKKDLERLTKEIKELERERAVQESSIEKITEKLAKLSPLEIGAKIAEEQQKLSFVNQNYIQVTTRLSTEQELIDGLTAKRLKLDEEIKLGQESVVLKRESLELLATQMLSVGVSQIDGQQVEQLSLRLTAETERYNDKNIELIQTRSMLENLKKEISFSESRSEEISKRVQEYNNQIENAGKDIVKIAADIEEIESKLATQYSSRDQLQSELSEIEQEFFGKRNIINEMEDLLRSNNRKSQQTQVSINVLKDKFSDVKFEMSSVGERLKIEFETELDIVLKMEIDETKNVKELTTTVTKMRHRIANYGDINPMAVDAYNTMKERHDLIEEQRNDILTAKESLLETIKEIEDTATQLFMNAFDKVRENFIEVFRSLFSEDDSCDLILLDRENPLESGIDIIARPKGKRPLSLSQLSGGEMTLTATALLFALYLQKPAPFCIFDEVDAPLDDANVLKFNKIIKKFSKDSQFVIVTHNKSTMAEVDVLYGVFMQDMGISSVSPVDFRSFKHNPILENVN